MTHEERARKFNFDHGGPFGNKEREERLIGQFAAVENAALERAARECLLHRTAEAVNIPSTGAFNRAMVKAHDFIMALVKP